MTEDVNGLNDLDVKMLSRLKVNVKVSLTELSIFLSQQLSPSALEPQVKLRPCLRT
jgi:hypothetical protein